MPEPAIGKAAPDFTVATDHGEPFRLSALSRPPGRVDLLFGRTTEGCALQNSEFTALMPEFEAANESLSLPLPRSRRRRARRCGRNTPSPTSLVPTRT